MNLQHFCGIAKKKDQQKEVKVFGDSEVFVFDMLEKNDMLFFKDRKNGTICRALGFLHLYRKKNWDQVENILIDCGMSNHEAKIEVLKEKSLIALYSDSKRFRDDHSAAQAKTGSATPFGDWMRMSRNEFVSIFGYVFETPIQKCSEYNICLMRDESGIPNCAHIYSTNNRFLGVANLGITSSATTLQYGRSIDNLAWNEARQVLCQEIDVASFVSKMLPDGATMPVGLIVSAGGIPNYGSVHFPVTFWVSRYDEIPHKIINFYNGNNSLFTYRLPNKTGESFTPTTSLSGTTLQKVSVEFCKDIAAFSARNKTNGIIDFVRFFLSSASINRESRTALVKEYAKRIGVDYEAALSLIRKYGIGSETVSFNKKNYFIKDSRYYSIAIHSKTGQAAAVSNFVVIPDRICTINGASHSIEGTLTCEGKSCPFLIPRNRFLWGNQFLEDLTQIADNNGLSIPIIYSHLDTSAIRKMILSAVADCDTVDTKQFGFNGLDSYITSSWMSSTSEIQFFKEKLPTGGQTDTFVCGGYDRDGKAYEKEAMAYLHSICKEDKMKTLIFFVLKILNMKLNGITGTLFLGENSFNCCSELLGCKISGSVEETQQLQMSLGDCTQKFAKKNGTVSIVLHRNILSKTRDTITFLDEVNRPSRSGVPLLPMITKLALSYSPPKCMQMICNTEYFEEIARADRLSYAFQSGEAKNFLDNIRELGLDKKLVRSDSNNITIEMTKCLDELKKCGIKTNKAAVIKNLRDMGVRFQYPVRKYQDRASCLVLSNNTENIFCEQTQN